MKDLSPEIVPTQYIRNTGMVNDDVVTVKYTFDGIDKSKVDDNPRAVMMSDGMLMYYSDEMVVYFGDGHCHVPDATYRNHAMVFLREYVLDKAVNLSDDGIIVGLRKDEDSIRR